MRRLYRLLLLAFPAALRRRWGSDMAQLARDHLDDARARGESRAKLVWLLVWDAVRNGLPARVQGRRRRVPRRGGGEMGWLEGFTRELAAAVRSLTRRPASAAAAVLLVAIGIGANTAVFSVVDAVLLRALPLPDADRLVRVFSVNPDYGAGNASLPEFEDWTRERGPFAALGAFYPTVHSLTTDGVPQRVVVASTAGDVFGAAGLEPALGRAYPATEPGAAEESALLLTDAFWKRTFGADESVVGRTMELDGRAVRIVGVLPPGEQAIRVGHDIDAWAPMEAPLPWMGRATGFLTVLGRLGPGHTTESAADPLLAMANGLIDVGQTENGIAIEPLKDALVGDTRVLLLAMQGAALLLMLLVAVNAANLLLARSLDRGGEFAVRAALGASRGTLARQILLETTVTALLGGLVGLGLAFVGRGLVVDLLPDVAALAGPVGLRWTVLAYTLLTALAAGVLAGIWPALGASGQAWASIKSGAGGRGSTRALTGQRALVALEVAMTLVLVVGAGLMVRTVSAVLDVDLGFEPDRVLTARLTLPEARYASVERRHRLWDDVLERVGTLPGVEAAGLTSALPLSQVPDGGSFRIEGREWDGAEAPSIDKKLASSGYFAALGIPVIEGRGFGSVDREGAQPVAIVSESMAKRFFPGESAVGRRIQLNWWGDDFLTVVGVVGDVRQRGPDQEAEIAAYVSLAQTGAGDAALVVRASGDAAELSEAVRAAVLEIDPDQPIYGVARMADLMIESIGGRRALRSLLLAVSALALLISCLGVYAVTAHAVRGRRQELGIRKALGATSARLLGAALLAESRAVGAGILLGLVGAAALTRTLRAFLFDVSPLDPLTLVVSVLALGGVASLAVLWPAWSSAMTDPRGSLASGG